MKDKFILDPCCSVRAMWFNKNHPNTLYGDIREEEKGFMRGRKESIKPDIIMDFRKMDLPDKCMKLVVFEPPHLSKLGKTSLFRKRFGCLEPETWQDDLRKGFNECWRIMEDYGILIFKWSNSEIPFKKVLSLIKHRPLFGNTTNYKATSVTKWFCFMKIPKEKKEIIKNKKEYGDWRDLPDKDYKQCKFCGKFFIDVDKHKNKVHGGKEQMSICSSE